MSNKAYEVLRITPMVKPSDLEGVEQYYRVTIKTRGGTVLPVDVDKEDFTEEKAAPILAEKAAIADKIKAL